MRIPVLAVAFSIATAGAASAQYPAYQFGAGSCPGGVCNRPVVQAVQDVRQSVGQAIHVVGNVVQGPVCQPVYQQPCQSQGWYPGKLVGRLFRR